jgi:predicted AAA+ superfamily ATPase
VLYQIIEHLEKQGLDKKACLHMNFEEPALSLNLSLDILDKLYDTYRTRIYPEGKAYIFFDEIQNVPEWERWVRARNETENIRIIVTGSSSELMSRELGTLLTGRHLTFEVYPLDFREQLQFKGIELPQEPWPSQAPPQIQHALLDYLQWGGLPRVVLSKNDKIRERLLTRYFEDMLYKDVIRRHDIRDVQTLRNIAVFLLTQTASLISYKRMCGLFNVSQDLVQAYCQYLQEAFLLELVPFYSLKTAERIRQPFKAHAIDLGLRRVVSFGQASDQGKLVESLVYRSLLDVPQDGLFYWQGKGEVDLLTRQGVEISRLVQVTFAGLDDPKTFQREISSLLEAGELYPNAEKLLIACELPKAYPNDVPKGINIIPLWHALLKL